MNNFDSYAAFTAAVVSLVAPLMPGDLDAKVRFSGCYGQWGWPSSDAATLRGERALFLEGLAIETESVTGIDSSLYRTKLGPASHMPLLNHSAYARNLRRWETGTLPRKAKARADFVLVAACWLLSWGAAGCQTDVCQYFGHEKSKNLRGAPHLLEAFGKRLIATRHEGLHGPCRSLIADG